MKEPRLEDYGLTKEVYEQYKSFLHGEKYSLKILEIS